MCYLSASNRGLFKSYYCCVLFFAIRKILRVVKLLLPPLKLYEKFQYKLVWAVFL